MLDFTSVLYLGFWHPTWSLQPWVRFTTGIPAALITPVSHLQTAQALAKLQGCEEATLSPSTLHLFWDLFGMMANTKVAIYMDAGIYPIARWGIERASACGVTVRHFYHHDTNSLKWQLRQDAACQLRPIVVTDGFCPSCGKIAPITEYLELIRTLNGYLIIDDTQAIGILGYKPGHQAPYGKGGGGSLRWSNTGGNDVIVISSMAKGFGVPMAVLAGSSYTVQQFEEKSETLVHCSPPSIAVVHAAKHALELNHQYGDKLRLRLAQLVNYFRQRLKRFNLYTRGGLFPVQTLVPIPGLDVRILHRRLTSMGVRTVLRRNCNGHSAHISFLITARHNMHDIDRAVDRVVEAIDNENVNSIKKKVNYEVSI